ELENLHDHAESDIAVARALADGSGHPLAVALAREAGKAGIQPADVTDIAEVPGQGVKGLLDGKAVYLGRPSWVGAVPSEVTATYLKIGKGAPVAFKFCDALRPGARDTVATLSARGLDVVLLSGDVSGAVADVAERVGISAWEAQMLPEDKAARVAILSGSGRKVLMVGDGLNDTAALASAHASISPASALEAARVVSDMVLLGNSLTPVAQALSVSKSATRRIKENFAIAAMYNAVAIPLALAGFATPLFAALAMSASSISVSLNALRLGRK
ncbi:MAG: HAD-IC family P-type ATPase, partial [Marinosulfonomonas sp.]|nr:HAD-IC family P-type ATPase [Marinosulfonomonas sp.]